MKRFAVTDKSEIWSDVSQQSGVKKGQALSLCAWWRHDLPNWSASERSSNHLLAFIHVSLLNQHVQYVSLTAFLHRQHWFIFSRRFKLFTLRHPTLTRKFPATLQLLAAYFLFLVIKPQVDQQHVARYSVLARLSHVHSPKSCSSSFRRSLLNFPKSSSPRLWAFGVTHPLNWHLARWERVYHPAHVARIRRVGTRAAREPRLQHTCNAVMKNRSRELQPKCIFQRY